MKPFFQEKNKMSKKKNLLGKIIISTAILIIIIIAAFIISAHLKMNKEQEKITREIQSKIFKNEKEIVEELSLINISIEKNDKSDLFTEFEYLNKYEKSGISFFVFRNDSMIYWSDNSVPLPGSLKDSLIKKNIIYLSNGCYYSLCKKSKEYTILSLLRIKYNYNYENDYLLNDFNKNIVRPILADIHDKQGAYNVFSNDGSFLFSIDYINTDKAIGIYDIIILMLYFLAVGILIYLIYLVLICSVLQRKNKSELVALFFFSLLALRILLFFINKKLLLNTTDFFSPVYFGSSELFPSFGDLILNVMILMVFSIVAYSHLLNFDYSRKPKKISAILLVFFVFLFSFINFLFCTSLLRSIVIDSTISYDLNQLFNLNELSLIGLIVIAGVLLSCFIISSLFQRAAKFSGLTFYELALIYLMVTVLVFFFGPFYYAQNYYLLSVFLFFNLVYMLINNHKAKVYSFYKTTFYIVIFTFIGQYILNEGTEYKELEKRRSLSQKLSTGEDPIAEYLFKNLKKQITTDKIINEKFKYYPENEQDIKEYLRVKYFNGFWEKYKVQFTICEEKDSLIVEPNFSKRNCFVFFDEIIKDIGRQTDTEELFNLNYGTGGNNYISRIDFTKDTGIVRVFIEMNSKFILRDLGYPELLIHKKLFLNTDLSEYSYAKYYKGALTDAYGKYYYSTQYNINDPAFINGYYFTDSLGYNHLYSKNSESGILVISKKEKNILDILAPFSLLFAFFVIYLIITSLLFWYPQVFGSIKLNFRSRLQISMVSLILITLVTVGLSTYYYIIKLDNNKNTELLREKTMSVLIELQGRLKKLDTMTSTDEQAISAFLVKLSNVFFTDINIFDISGRLISSSRPQVFNEGLIAPRMNTTAYQEMKGGKKTFYIQKERIGTLEYYSAYAPFFDNNNQELYYINLPYFARETELKKELTAFLMAFINIYVFLIMLSVIIVLIIAGTISRPLLMIREKISRFKLGSKNEKIYWNRKDEIGSLVDEYNRMVDEVLKSTELLARSERESAWREMAMQVAHEIKNPLTPMKLSVQYLEKAWKEKAPDWGSRFEKFSHNIIEQIDTLSTIATEFSDFAKLPNTKKERVELVSLMKNVVSLFELNNQIKINLFTNDRNEYFVFADKKQMLRVMNNLLNNSLQAMDKENGEINIFLKEEDKMLLITIQDNGRGISGEMRPKIFMPNFSTKSDGMGLGLAIVKGIVENFSGEIWFESEEGKWTKFFISLPLISTD